MSTKQEKLQAPLTTADIDFRVQSINKGGYATILAYKDARVDMNRLNQTYGVGFWQRKHELIGSKEFCSVGVWNSEIKDWCWLQDTGTKSNTEAAKGESSDAFKRACFNLGIGIELYDYPLMSIQLKANEVDLKAQPKPKATWSLKLKEWRWYAEHDESGSLSYIAAKDQNGEVRFRWGNRKPATKPEVEQPK